MATQTKAPAVGAARGESAFLNRHADHTRKRPAFAKTFHADERGFAIVCLGWPPVRPPAGNVLALPPDESPAAIDWRLLRGCHVLTTPPPGAHAPHDVLRELGAELAAAGVASLTIFDGTEVVADWWRAGRPKVSP